MNKIFSVFTFLALSLSVSAEQNLEVWRAKYEPLFQKIEGYEGTMWGLCDPTTGLQAVQRDQNSELCFVVILKKAEDLARIQSLFKTPARIEGVMVGWKIGSSGFRLE